MHLPALPEGFGRAAEKLADTVRHVVDIAVGPERIRARAQAQADSAVILAEGRGRVQEVEARAVERLRKREARRQQNIESITVQALKALPPPEQISEKPVSEDWTSRFFEECQDISDEQMQQIWARIMAGEVTQPGSFAPRTLSVVHDLTKDDANLFAKLCQLVWFIPGAAFVPIIHNHDAPLLTNNGINFARLTHLTSIGLIEFNTLTGYVIGKPLKEIKISYCDKNYQMKHVGDAEAKFSLGHTIFTAVGQELLKVANSPGNEEYRKAALEEWNKMGWKEEGEPGGSAYPNDQMPTRNSES